MKSNKPTVELDVWETRDWVWQLSSHPWLSFISFVDRRYELSYAQKQYYNLLSIRLLIYNPYNSRLSLVCPPFKQRNIHKNFNTPFQLTQILETRIQFHPSFSKLLQNISTSIETLFSLILQLHASKNDVCFRSKENEEENALVTLRASNSGPPKGEDRFLVRMDVALHHGAIKGRNSGSRRSGISIFPACRTPECGRYCSASRWPVHVEPVAFLFPSFLHANGIHRCDVRDYCEARVGVSRRVIIAPKLLSLCGKVKARRCSGGQTGLVKSPVRPMRAANPPPSNIPIGFTSQQRYRRLSVAVLRKDLTMEFL